MSAVEESGAVVLGLVDTGLGAGIGEDVRESLVAARAFAWDTEKDRVRETEAFPDALGHGGALATSALNTAPELRLLMAQVFFDQWRTRPAQVAAAIEWLCASGARVINLSLGLRADRPVLQQACDTALAAGVILVASSPARGEAVFPAAYKGVIRATGDARCAPSEFSWLDTAEADVGACVNSECGSVVGASVGAAYISAHIARYLQNHSEAGSEEVLSFLEHHASYTGAERRGV